jgi:hypothetical protein
MQAKINPIWKSSLEGDGCIDIHHITFVVAIGPDGGHHGWISNCDVHRAFCLWP